MAPRARLASSYSRGTARRAVSDTLMMEGSTIMDSTRMAASRQAPDPREKVVRISGTSTIMPTRPYTTDGIPASSCTAGSMTRLMAGLAKRDI